MSMDLGQDLIDMMAIRSRSRALSPKGYRSNNSPKIHKMNFLIIKKRDKKLKKISEISQ